MAAGLNSWPIAPYTHTNTHIDIHIQIHVTIKAQIITHNLVWFVFNTHYSQAQSLLICACESENESESVFGGISLLECVCEVLPAPEPRPLRSV